MPAARSLELVFISDLHLGAPWQEATPFYTTAFCRFLGYLSDAARRDQRDVRLVLLGDTLDFLAVALSPSSGRAERAETTAEAALAKLDQLAHDHTEVFEALGRFSGQGLNIDVILGNHDVDLVRPSVQQRFRELLGRVDSHAAHRLRFHPWIYYVPGVVYAEHGHQHHDINALTTVVRPYVSGDRELETPIATCLAVRRQAAGLTRLGANAGTAVCLLRHGLQLFGRGRAVRRALYRREVLEPYAEQVGLDHRAVVAIDRLSEVSALSMAKRLLKAAIRHRVERPGRPTQRGGYVHEAALAIHEILRTSSAEVPYYLFAHTHIAERFALTSTSSAPEYLNTGTWSSALPRGLKPRHGLPLPTFVHLTWDPGSPRPVARLLMWDAKAGQPRLLLSGGRSEEENVQ